MNKEVVKRMNNKKLSQYACHDRDAILLKNKINDIRTPFFRDADRILYSLSYTRYIDKTQAFTFNSNDHISKRMTHVQFVSKIARTIGRALGLNEDLIEAAALGHDLGHPPFGHCGEVILNKISMENNEGVFAHNIQSVRTLMSLENNGNGVNISLQVLDAILCHNGEMLETKYTYINKTKEDFLKEYENCYKNINASKKLIPMTKEGCVVRISDVIGYIGRDVEDAIRLNLITKEDLPVNVVNVLGYSNSKIVNTIVLDIVKNSNNKPYIKLSKKVYNALQELINFNYQFIYNKINTEKEKSLYEAMYRTLFDKYIKDLSNDTSKIHTLFLDKMTEQYKKNTSPARIVLDYISGMTDNYFINEYNLISQIKIKR